MKLQQAIVTLEIATAALESDGWIMLFPTGKSQGYDGRGPYVLPTEDIQQVIAASLRSQVDLPIDWEHAIDLKPAGEEKPAAGWIKELQARPDGLYGRVEWTPKAQQQLADKEYRYISPTFWFDRATGLVKRLMRASLVAVPNLEVKALAAADVSNPEKENTMNETLKAIAKMLGLADDATEAQILEAVQALKDTDAKVKDAVDAPATATGDAVVEAIKEKAAEEVQAATAAAKEQTKKQLQKEMAAAGHLPADQAKHLLDRLEKLETASAKTDAQKLVDDALRDGKVTPGNKDWAMEYASANPEGFKDFVKKAPKIVTEGEEVHTGGETSGQLDKQQLAICTALSLSPEDFAKSAKSQKA